MKHPMYSKELLRMFDEDQVEIRSREKVLAAMQTDAERERYRLQITENCHRRAARTLEILDAIGAPTIENIGPAAAEIVSVLVLHSYVDEMKRLLKIYEKQYIRDPDSIYRQAIPPLTDRIMIVEQRKQKFGTNWNVTDEGQWFLISVEDFTATRTLRARYGLGPIQKPRNLSIGAEEYPLGKGEAEAADQKALTDEEYRSYVEWCVRPEPRV